MFIGSKLYSYHIVKESVLPTTFSGLCFTAVCLATMCIDADVRLARRIRRDTVERGRDINSVLEQVIFSHNFSSISIRRYFSFCV